VGIRCANHSALYPQKLALTLPTSFGCSVGIVRWRTKVTEFNFSLALSPRCEVVFAIRKQRLTATVQSIQFGTSDLSPCDLAVCSRIHSRDLIVRLWIIFMRLHHTSAASLSAWMYGLRPMVIRVECMVIYESSPKPIEDRNPGDGGFFIPSTQRHCRRLILLLILLHVSIVQPSSGRNILLTRITLLTTDG
jgi:hypothetical protein